MSLLTELYAALSGDAVEVQAVTDAQAVLNAATATAATAATSLTNAQAALTAANDAVVDTGNVTPEEQTAIDAAQAVVDTATTDKATADTAVTDAQAALTTAQGNVDSGDSVEIAAGLSITDFGMISNDAARAILAARGETVKFEEPEVVASDYNMNPYV